jgi:catechol 2,3-dioxygenase-like lactoylglutathione lyase family enzyme
VHVLASRILLHPSDLERSLRFYGETLGLAVFREWGGGSNRGVVFFLGAGLLEVSRSSTEPPSGAVRLLLQVRDVHEEWRRLAAANVVIEEEPKRRPWASSRWWPATPTDSRSSSWRFRPGTRSAGRRDAASDAKRGSSRTGGAT